MKQWGIWKGELLEPKDRALIACQIQEGGGGTWTDRTYEVMRGPEGLWIVDLGGGVVCHRWVWRDVLDLLQRLGPRDVEMMEV